MTSITLWNLAQRPNNTTNIEKIYPYSEVPYIGQYHLVKLPFPTDKDNLIDHVDYWGEGRINTTLGTSGFPDCYNVNHHYQLVSNGPDTDRKIPNRIPVISYTNCDTSSYIKDNSVKVVTLMGAPINKSCARDIARMVNVDSGKVVVFGFDSNTADIRNLDEELTKKSVLHSPDYNVPDMLKGLTLFDSHRAYLNLSELSEELYKNINDSAYANAVTITKTLENAKKGNIISDVVTKLLKEGKKTVIMYAYKLWNDSAKYIVDNHFPDAFKLIFNEDFVKIVNKKDLVVLKLDTSVDSNSDRLALGDNSDNASNKWKIIPVLENNELFFKIMNVDYNIYLKLEAKDGEEGKKAKGSTNTDSNSIWNLEPMKVNGDMLFFILNRAFNQGMRFDEKANTNGERPLLGNNGPVNNDPNNFGWFITPYDYTYEYVTRSRSKK